ncbi:hypothetical protein CK203_045618 [Vitis vinifera]|uniref:Uncharacterized protein n=1 Tax=Vitis vinifera TaxID=29760 RepID=A0A438HQ71_VITVI|nr:hypothetical protein CK203_045618 [Vitis vinifera]
MGCHVAAPPICQGFLQVRGINPYNPGQYNPYNAGLVFRFINNGQQYNLMLNYLSAILALIAFVDPVLIKLIDLKFQKEVDSVFEAHPITTMMFFASLLVFVLTFGIELTFHSSHLSPTCAALLRTAMMFSGSLSLTSLASVLLPDALRPLLYAFCAFLSLANLHNLVRKWYHWVHRAIVDNLETALTGEAWKRIQHRSGYLTCLDNCLSGDLVTELNLMFLTLLPSLAGLAVVHGCKQACSICILLFASRPSLYAFYSLQAGPLYMHSTLCMQAHLLGSPDLCTVPGLLPACEGLSAGQEGVFGASKYKPVKVLGDAIKTGEVKEKVEELILEVGVPKSRLATICWD